jgi:hypothetical protein
LWLTVRLTTVLLSTAIFSVSVYEGAGSFPDAVIGFFDLRIPSSRAMALGSTQLLTEMSIRNLPGVRGRKTDNFTTICEPIV